MKKQLIIIGIIFVLLAVGFSGCETNQDGNTGGAAGYQYWKGEIPNSYYLLNSYGERALKVTGKPFMVLTYDRISLEITDCEFGLSEVTQEAIPNPSDLPLASQPTLDANAIDFHEKLDLRSPVDLVVMWNVHMPNSGDKSIINGFQNFSFRSGYQMAYNIGHTTEWSFSYNSVSMVGGAKNIDTNLYSGSESETNAFNLLKK